MFREYKYINLYYSVGVSSGVSSSAGVGPRTMTKVQVFGKPSGKYLLSVISIS